MKKIISSVLLSSFLGSVTFAQTLPPEEQPSPEFSVEKKTKSLNEILNETRENRGSRPWQMLGNYSLFETWVLNKYGLSVVHNIDSSTSYEFEYARGGFGFSRFGIDIGDVTEQRFSIQRRTFGERNSLGFLLGVYYNKINLHLGSDLVATLSGNDRFSANVARVDTLGLSWGVGNRWQLKNGFIWSVDWLTVQLPFTTLRENTPFDEKTSDAEKREDFQDALGFLKHFPSFAVAKIQLGFSF